MNIQNLIIIKFEYKLFETTKMEHNLIELKDGDYCKVISGAHKGKQGIIQDLKASKTGHFTITVKQENNVRFKTLAKNVELINVE